LAASYHQYAQRALLRRIISKHQPRVTRGSNDKDSSAATAKASRRAYRGIRAHGAATVSSSGLWYIIGGDNSKRVNNSGK